MLEVKIADRDVSSGSIAITWCVDQELIKQLADAEVADPQVVICVAPSGDKYSSYKEYRKVVPLSDLMTYIEFRVPGPNKIWAFVSTSTKRQARDGFTKRSSGIFTTDILNSYGDEFADDVYKKYGAEPVSVLVPEDAFAPEPSQFEKDWVNHFFKEKAIDQCHFRKRRLFAYTVQVVLMFLNLLVRVFLQYGIALAIGARNLSLKYLLHPLTYSLDDSFKVIGGGSYFVRTWAGDAGIDDTPFSFSYYFRKFILLPLMPLFSIPIVLLTYFHQWKTLGIISGIGVGVVLVMLAIYFFAEGIARKTFYAVSDWVEGLLGHKDMYYLDKGEMEMLICDGKEIRRIRDLPSKKRTLSLRFFDFKAKVCRPFSA